MNNLKNTNENNIIDEYKKELFLYFCKKLLEKYSELGSPKKDIVNRYHVLKMLFLSVIYNENMISKFNDFYAMVNGPVEKDCYNIIYKSDKKFEYLLYKGFFKDNNFITLSEDDKILVNTSINLIPETFFKKNYEYLSDYSKKYKSWKESWEVALEYGVRSYKIDNHKIRGETVTLLKVMTKINDLKL